MQNRRDFLKSAALALAAFSVLKPNLARPALIHGRPQSLLPNEWVLRPLERWEDIFDWKGDLAARAYFMEGVELERIWHSSEPLALASEAIGAIVDINTIGLPRRLAIAVQRLPPLWVQCHFRQSKQGSTIITVETWRQYASIDPAPVPDCEVLDPNDPVMLDDDYDDYD